MDRVPFEFVTQSDFREKSDSEKMEIMYVVTKKCFRALLQCGLRCNKSNVKSLEIRFEGNGYFASRKYEAAFSAYSSSASFAEPDTEFLGLAYANRSAALFELGFYESCLENIKLARKSKYPKKLLAKLENREERCHRALQKGTKSDRKIELTGNPHPSVPFISDCLFYNREKKSIFTSKDLAPGDLVAIEEPFCAVQEKKALAHICWNCLKSSFVTIPCERCAAALFCSEDCRVKYEMCHKYECPLMNLITKCENVDLHLIMRMLFTAIGLFQSVDDFRKFCESPDNKKDNIFEMDKSSFDAKEYFKLICGTNTYRRDLAENIRVFFNAATVKIMLEHTDLKNVFSTDAEIKFLTEQLLHFSKIFHYKQITDKNTFGCRMYGLSKYLRHSCEPNVERVCSKDGKSLIFVLRPIPPNKELLENYWETDQVWMNVESWNRISRKLCKFTCFCERCIFERPLEFYMDIHPRIPFNQIEADFHRIREFDRKYAEKNCKRFANFIQKYNKYPNCRQITFAVFCLKRCLEIMHTTSVDYL